MTKNILLTLTAFLIAATVSAQPGQRGGRGYEQVEAEKIAYFTRILDLSRQEAREFWPVYNDFQEQKEELVEERRSLAISFSENYENMDEKEAEKIGDSFINLQVKETELAREFHDKFKTVLTPKKVMRFYQAENEFRMLLLRRIRGGGRGAGRIDPESIN